MGFINIIDKTGLNQDKKERDQDQTQTDIYKTFEVDTKPPSPSNPVSEQAKEKLTTSAYFKAVFKSSPAFTQKLDNLSIKDLKYIINKSTVDAYLRTSGNDIDKTDDYRIYKTIKDDFPDKLIGGGQGEEELRDIDLKKTYNSEAKALAVAYYSNKNNVKDMKKMLYAVAATYAYGGLTDLDELKKKTENINFDKMSNEEIELEFKKIFSKANEQNQGKMKFLNAMINRLDKLQNKAEKYQNVKIENIAEKYSKLYEEKFNDIFGTDKQKGDIIVEDFINNLKVINSSLKKGEKIKDLTITENTPDELKKALVYINGINSNINQNTVKEELTEKLKEFNKIELLAKKNNFAVKAGAEFNIMLHRRLNKYTSYDILKAAMGNKLNDFPDDEDELHKIQKELKKAFNDNAKILKKRYPEEFKDITGDKLYEQWRQTLLKNSEAIKNSLQYPEEAQYDPFFNTIIVDTDLERDAGNVLNDTFYLSLFKEIAKENEIDKNFTKSFNESEFLENSLKSSKENSKFIEEIEDVNNIMKTLNNISEGKINSTELNALMDTQLFKTNSILDNEAKKNNFKSFVNDYSKINEKLLKNKIFKKLTDEEINDYSSKKYYDTLDKNINSKFIQTALLSSGNLRIAKDYHGCVKKANIVDTKLGSQQGNMKQCVDNFISKLEQKQKELENEIYKKQTIYNPFVGFMILASIVRGATVEAIKEKMDITSAITAEKLRDIQDSPTAQERFGKFALYKAEELGASQDLIDPEYENLYKDTIYETFVKKNLNQDNISKMFELNFSDYELDGNTMQKIFNLKENITSFKEDIKTVSEISKLRNELENQEIILNEKLSENQNISKFLNKYSLEDIYKLNALKSKLNKEELNELKKYVSIKENYDNVSKNVNSKYKTDDLSGLLDALHNKLQENENELISMQDDIFILKNSPKLAKEDKRFFEKYFESAFKGSNIEKNKEELQNLKNEIKELKRFTDLRNEVLGKERKAKILLMSENQDINFKEFLNNPENYQDKISKENFEKLKEYADSSKEYKALKEKLGSQYKNINGLLREKAQKVIELENKINSAGLEFEYGKYSQKNIKKMINFYENALNDKLTEKFNAVKNNGFFKKSNDKEIKALKEKLAFLKTVYFYEDAKLAENIGNEIGLGENDKQEFINIAKNKTLKEAIEEMTQKFKDNDSVIYHKFLNYSGMEGIKDLQEINNNDNLNQNEKEKLIYEKINNNFNKILSVADFSEKEEILKTNAVFTKFDGNIMTTAIDEKAIFFKELEESKENNNIQKINELLGKKEKFGINELNTDFIKNIISGEKDGAMKIATEQIKHSRRKM